MTQLRKKKFESSLVGIRRRELNYVYRDIVCPLLVRNTGAGRPVLQPFIGNINVYQFAVNDWVEFEAVEAPHDWVEGSEIEFHLHWATGGNNDNTPRAVKWQLEYAFANPGKVYTTSYVIDQETIIPSGELGKKLKYTQIGKDKLSTGKIGGQLLMRLTRIASDGDAPAVSPFAFQLGIHYLCDALGSKTMAAK